MIIETLVSMFTVQKGRLKVLLVRKKTDPYKGYWILPGSSLKKDETIEDSIIEAIREKIGFLNIYLEQSYVYSDVKRDPNNRVVACSFISLVDSTTVSLKQEQNDYEKEWFNIDELPKIAYDHEDIIKRSIGTLRKKLASINALRILFPSDFTLPEIQKVYEQILDKTLDRRNFRKKFIHLGLIEETGDKNEGGAGRPAKMYRFKDEIENVEIF